MKYYELGSAVETIEREIDVLLAGLLEILEASCPVSEHDRTRLCARIRLAMGLVIDRGR